MRKDQMRQWVLRSPHELVIEDAPVPSPGPGEALLKVHCVGICGSDMHAYRGHQPFLSYPRVLGHELGLEVVEIEADNPRDLRPGDRVTLEPALSCGRCYPCRHGCPNACVNIQVLGVHADGGLREYATFPAASLHRSETLDYEELALVEPVAIGAHAVRRGDVKADELVLIIGAGTIGISAMQCARCRGARAASGDIYPRKLELARQFGADYAIDISDAARAVDEVMAITNGEGADVVIEAVGLPQTIESTVDYVAAGGRIVILGVGDGYVTFPQKVIVGKELNMLGSRNSHGDFPQVLDLMEQGRLHMKDFVSHRFSFDEAAEAYAFIREHPQEVNKALIHVTP